jgi:nucleoside 2-deoxyribosyltransferase
MTLIYVAGPLFSDVERAYLESMVDYIAGKTSLDPVNEFFLPHRDIGDAGVTTMKSVFNVDVGAILECDILVAWLDGVTVDPGTAVEIGIAFANQKTIVGLLTDRRFSYDNINNMIRFGCTIICRSLDEVCSAIGERLEV